MMKVLKEQRKRFPEKENRDRRNRDHEDREVETDNNRDYNLQRFPEKRKSARKVEGFGANANFASYDDKDTLKSESVMLYKYLQSLTNIFENLLRVGSVFNLWLYRWGCNFVSISICIFHINLHFCLLVFLTYH